jgi:type IV pilus assembly protein PilC
MIECRFVAENSAGKAISGSVIANNAAEAKKKIHALAEKNGLRVQSIQKKSAWMYTARKGKDKPIRGEQKAFTKQEVVEALTRFGYDSITVNKKLLDFAGKPP